MATKIPLFSQSLGNRDSLAGVITEAIKGYMTQYIDSCLPAIVTSAYDADTNTVSVKPLVKIITTDGNSHSRSILKNIPVYNLGNSEFSIRMQIPVGTLGYIIANDQDTTNFNRSLIESLPNTFRRFSHGDSFFLPSNMEKGISTTAPMTITNSDQTVKIELFSDRIDVTAPTINVNANTANINATNTNLGSGGPAIARLGDQVTIGTSSGTITSASSNNTST